MLASLILSQFRCFERFELNGLARVNVVLGKNNTGKSSVLEAVELLAQKGHPSVLARQLRGRGQTFVGQEGNEYLDASELFLGRRFEVGTSCEVAASAEGGMSGVRFSIDRGPRLSISPDPGRGTGVDLADGRGLMLGPASSPAALNVVHLGSALTGPQHLQVGWAALVGNPGEDLIVEALQTIVPDIARIVHAPVGLSSGWGGWFLKRAGVEVREPLGGLGEGVKRMLALAVSLATAERGTLLIDEVENGMHFEVVPAFWRFLIRTARKLDVQVFITSHSRDLIDGFSEAQRREASAFDDVAFFRLEQGRSSAVRMEAAVAVTATEFGQELR